MANLGYALAQGLAGASRGVGILADQYTKQEAEQRAADRQLANQERLMATQEMMRQRAKEWDQVQSAKMGGKINDMASGILAREDAATMGAASGSSVDPTDPATAETLRILNTPEGAAARAAYEKAGYVGANDESAQVKRKAEAAGILGDTTRQKELYDRSKDIEISKHQGKRDEESIRHNKEMEKNNAEKVQAMLTNHSLAQQLAMAKADKKLPETTKAAVDAYWKTYEGIKKDTNLPAEDVKKRLDDLESDFMQKFPPTGWEEMKGGKVRVETALGTSKIYDSKEAAADALGFGKSKPAAAPAKTSSPVVDAIRTGVQDVIGASKPAPYTPPPDSPAGKRAGILEDQRRKDKQSTDEAFADAEAKVMQALKSGDPLDAQAAQSSPGFKYLPQSYQVKIFKLVNGR